jgi:PTS system galactitol-specific IIA component
MLSPRLCVAKLRAASAEAAIRALAKLLREAGNVTASFETAAVAREKRSPTGLPFAPIAVALPHAEPEHVERPGIAVASLATPVKFRQMGSPATQLEVSLVVMPALSSKEQAAAGLARIIEKLQDAALREELLGASSGEALCAALAARWET